MRHFRLERLTVDGSSMDFRSTGRDLPWRGSGIDRREAWQNLYFIENLAHNRHNLRPGQRLFVDD